MTTMTTENVPEMGRYLRQIVDNAFEEGHFESAVAMLEQLRSPDHKPSMYFHRSLFGASFLS
jgi:hypothetical protein